MSKKLVSFKFNVVIISTFILLNACSNNNSATTGNQIIDKPGSPKKVFASYENNKSTLTWDAPDSTATVSYYQVERSLLDKNVFNKISPQLPTTQLTFTDPIINRKFGDSFEYRVLAGYSTSTKISEVSNVITPGPALNTSHSQSDFFSSNYAWANSRFGFKIAFDADGSSIAVASKEGVKDGGGLIMAVEIFKRDKANKWNMVSSVTAPWTNILQSFAYSPDGNVIAISDFRQSAGKKKPAYTGTVEIFTKNTVGEWDIVNSTILVSPAPGKYYKFGSAIKFSPDNKTLAVAENGTGIVRFYNKTANAWKTQATSTFNIHAFKEPNLFDMSIAFNPDGTLFAIGDTYANGKVQLYSRKIDGSWNSVASTVFKPKQGDKVALFGQRIAFSPDGNSIAISEETNQIILDNTKTYSGGTVQLFSKDSANKWKTIPDTVFVSSASRTSNFGSNITFNNTGTLLVIGGLFSQVYDEKAIFTGGNTSPVGGAVFIYKKDNSGAWVNRPSAVLASDSPIDYAYYGRSFVFSPTENKLFVGEPQGLVNQRSYGSVNIYDSSLF